MMGLDSGRKFAGTEQVGWLAYNLTSDRTHGLGTWSDAQIAQYLSSGHADGRGPASGPMAEVVEKSLRYLTPEDIRSIVAYLRTIPPQQDGPVVVAVTQPVAPTDALGAHLFEQACTGCHLPDGAGRQSPWAALRGAQSAADPAGTNVVQVLTHGAQIGTSEGVMFMHPFTGAYSDTELAALARYVAGQFGAQRSEVTQAQIRKAREAGANAGAAFASNRE